MNDDVLFTEISRKGGDVGLITLNRTKALNALTQQMCIDLYEKLSLWQMKQSIKAVIIQGNGERAFCAGGDIRYFYEMRHDKNKLMHFFQHEYRLDHYIFHYPKPFIALLHGITMGGGAGISINGKHRIAAEDLVLAMPETGIGFHPDVGSGYFLTRCRGQMGWYLGLVGARINAADALAIKLIDAIVPKENFSKLIALIAEAEFSSNVKEDITNIIKKFSIIPNNSKLLAQQEIINDCFAKKSIEEIITTLQRSNSEWEKQTAAELLSKSPSSLKVTLRKLQESKRLSFDECIKMDYQLTYHFIQNQDFYEGIRAAIIDKDHNPKWQPATLAAVTQNDVDAYFAPLNEEINFA